jgi:hypothetical protein
VLRQLHSAGVSLANLTQRHPLYPLYQSV